MRKTDKKIENALRKALTQACSEALKTQDGFKWLTHFANYQHFPNSLAILCVFDTNDHLLKADSDGLRSIINAALTSIDINVKDIREHVSFDTEENGVKNNADLWQARFRR